MARRNPLDMLSTAELVQINETVFWDRSRPLPIAALDSDTDFKPMMGERPDFLAYRELQSSNLGWAIMDRNSMRLWPNDMVPGQLMKIPTRESLRARGIIRG